MKIVKLLKAAEKLREVPELSLVELIEYCIEAEIINIDDNGDAYWYHTGEYLKVD